MQHRFNYILAISIASCFAAAPVFAKAPKTVTVSNQSINKILYYNGKVAPIVNVPVISPTAGVIAKMHFNYGEIVKKDQILLSVASTKIINSLRSAKVAYLNALQTYDQTKDWTASTDYINAANSMDQAKRTYTQAHNTYEENIHLYKLGIISKDQLNQSEDSNANDLESYNQSVRSFKKTQAKGKGNYLLIKKLQFETANAKYQSLLKQVSAKSIHAPASGIVLMPVQNNQSSGNNSNGNNAAAGKLQVGSSIQYQQVLLNIGNMSGLKISFDVPEIDINKITKGLKATITGSGFAGVKLSGTITSIGAQASTQNGGGSLPSFPVIVNVPKLSTKAAKLIRSGMDAQIAIDVSKKQKSITIPISAVHHNKAGKPYVYVYNPQDKSTEKLTIKTGTVGVKSVEVTQGLQSGDQVVLGKGN